MSVVYVLEDMDHRIKTLAGWLPDDEIYHSPTVEGFLGVLRAGPAPDLVILDHDLGGVPKALGTGSRDASGQTGMDAVRLMPDVTCPVIVWSVNSVRAPLMARELQRRGMNAGWLPFGHHRLHVVVGKALT